MDNAVRRTLYLTFACAQLCYGSILWAPQTVSLIPHRESVQRQATKYVLDQINPMPTIKTRVQSWSDPDHFSFPTTWGETKTLQKSHTFRYYEIVECFTKKLYRLKPASVSQKMDFSWIINYIKQDMMWMIQEHGNLSVSLVTSPVNCPVKHRIVTCAFGVVCDVESCSVLPTMHLNIYVLFST